MATDNDLDALRLRIAAKKKQNGHKHEEAATQTLELKGSSSTKTQPKTSGQDRKSNPAAANGSAKSTGSEQHDVDLIPDEPYGMTESDAAMDSAIASIDIIDAYARWCGKMVPEIKPGQVESIMISCPKPDHADKIPSAWINIRKQTWFCGGCQEGGDTLDLAAFHFGYPAPDYKKGFQYGKLRNDMAKDFGFTITKLPGGVVSVIAPEKETVTPTATVLPFTKPVETESFPDKKTDATVVKIYDEDGYEETLVDPLEWRNILPNTGTFLDTYMDIVSKDDIPEEYHLFNGLLALGFALGRDVKLFDRKPVHSNLFICSLGRTGSGKSQASSYLRTLLIKSMPANWEDENSKGTVFVNSPGSSEVLIHSFMKPVTDPTNPKHVAYFAPVRGLIEFNELSALVGKAARAGNVTVPTMMQFYDADNLIATSSMTHGSKEAHMSFGSALTTTQPRTLKDLLGRNDASSGFLNRWVFVPGTEKKRIAIGGAIIDITPAVKPLVDIWAWASSFGPDELIQWSDEAAAKFTQFFNLILQPAKKKSTTELITRIDLLMKKFILLFTANEKLKIVPIESVDKAIQCYSYILDGFGLIDDQLGNTIMHEIESHVVAFAKKRWDATSGGGVTLRDIGRSLAKHKYPNDMLLKACDQLVKLEQLKTVTSTKKTGPVTVRYVYVE